MCAMDNYRMFIINKRSHKICFKEEEGFVVKSQKKIVTLKGVSRVIRQTSRHHKILFISDRRPNIIKGREPSTLFRFSI